ncbi:MAG TPA: nucleotidyltransferase family protein [Alphaproteobacteria bacterium]|nr:nucleotidyltransferase family protein [Alphaproteobacteria bacterium]
MTAPETAMILAAGRGTRMGPLTQDRPKPLLSLGGRALVDYVIDRLLAAGVRRIVVNLHHHADLLQAHLQRRDDVELLFSDERNALLDTGGGLARALPLLGAAPFFAVNGDAVWFDAAAPALGRLAARFDPGAMDGLLLLMPSVRATGYRGRGDFEMGADGRLIRRQERAVTPFVYTGVQLLSPTLFDGHPAGAFSLNLLYDQAIEQGRLFGLRHEGDWMELNTPEGLAAAEAALAP